MPGICNIRRWMALLLAAATLGGVSSGAAPSWAAAQARSWTMDEILRQVDRGAK